MVKNTSKQKTPTKKFTFHKSSPETERHNNAINSYSSHLFAPIPQHWPSSLGRWQGGGSSSRDLIQEEEECRKEERFFFPICAFLLGKRKLSLLPLAYLPSYSFLNLVSCPGQMDRPCLWPIRSTYWPGGGIKLPEPLAWQVKGW